MRTLPQYPHGYVDCMSDVKMSHLTVDDKASEV